MSERNGAASRPRVGWADLMVPGALKPIMVNMDPTLPKGLKVRQKLYSGKLDDVEAAVREQLRRPEVRERIRPGQRVAVGVGSRGISAIFSMVKACVAGLKEIGAEPFIVPAMGSHGGAKAEGQAALLAEYGITEESVGAPIVPDMDVVELGKLEGRVPVYFSRAALEADAVVPVCRVKPHTAFRAPIESGIAKMLAIGFGKHRGAQALHSEGFLRFKDVIPGAARIILDRVPVAFGLAVVENGLDEPALVEAVPADRILEREPELLALAREWMGRILVDEFDLLIVDEIGKNISGDGMDPNVTGRFSAQGVTGGPKIQKIVVTDLTDETQGNYVGLGQADIVTRRVLEKADFYSTYINAITSTVLVVSRMPLVMETDRDAVVLGLNTLNGVKPADARVVRIKNTLELSTIWISEPLWEQVKDSGRFEPLGPVEPLAFDPQEKLLPLAP